MTYAYKIDQKIKYQARTATVLDYWHDGVRRRYLIQSGGWNWSVSEYTLRRENEKVSRKVKRIAENSRE